MKMDETIPPVSESKKKEKREFDFSRYPKRRIALLFLYFGWKYNGLTEQREINKTIEEEIKKALLKTKLIENWKTCGWNRSGRTDKGVSAFRQIASVIVRSTEPGGLHVFWPNSKTSSSLNTTKGEMRYVKMLNGTLPSSIRVLAWAPVAEDFNARHECTERTYTYVFPRANLNIEKMQEACQLLIGKHDFRNFCRIDMNKERLEMSYVRTITRADVLAISTMESNSNLTPYDFLQLTIKGNGFLWHQIRCIMALLYEIGCENEKPELITELLDINLTPSKPVYGLASPIPLCLFDCSHDGTELLWNWDTDSLKSIKAHILKTWAHYETLSFTLRNMAEGIGVLKSELKNDYSALNDFLKPNGSSTKTYLPIRKRRTCDALEVKQEKMRAKMARLEAAKNNSAATC